MYVIAHKAMIYVLVDGSYYCFFRYYAMRQWWNNAHPGEPLENPIGNEDFVKRYSSAFVNKLLQLKKEVAKVHGKTETIRMWAGKDCPRANIWRMALFPGYKKNRERDDAFEGGPFFAMAYPSADATGLFADAGCETVLRGPSLEADDCIAIATQLILSESPDNKVVIVASDMDYLQLAQDRVTLMDLKYKLLTDSPKCYGDPAKDLFCKIMAGDTSDCIPGVFPKCGPKTAAKCYDDPDYRARCMAKHTGAADQLVLNSTLIDMRMIPVRLQEPVILQVREAL